MDIKSVNGGAARRVNAVEELRQLHEVVAVFKLAWPAATVEIGAIGRAAYGGEGDPFATDPDAVLRVSRVESEF